MTQQTKIMKKDISIDDCWNHIGVWATGDFQKCDRLKSVIHCRNCEKFSIAGQQILEQPLSDEYLEEWANIYSREKEDRKIGTQSSLVFRLGDEWYSLPAKIIAEITPMQKIHTLPHNKTRALRGLVNIRGELKICISLGYLLSINKGKISESPERKYTSYERMIVIEHEEQQFVFPVSEILGTCRYHEDDIQAPPATVANAKATFTRGMLHYSQKYIACLDHELMFYSMERSMK